MGRYYYRLAGYSVACLLAMILCFASGRAGELSLKENEAGKKLYTAKCAKCHKFYDPNAYSQAEWNVWMGKMRKKSKLKPDQFEILSRYIDTLRIEEKAEIKAK